MSYLMKQLALLRNVVVYDEKEKRVSTCCITVNNVTTDKVVQILDNHGICVRGGIHCAILAHEALKTVKTGAVRISLNYSNSINEIEELIGQLKDIGE